MDMHSNNNMVHLVSNHRPVVDTKGRINKATRAPHNTLNIASRDKYQALQQDSHQHISTDTHRDRLANTHNPNMAEDTVNRSHRRTADTKGVILRTSLRRRVSIHLNSRLVMDHLRSTEGPLVMEAIRNIRNRPMASAGIAQFSAWDKILGDQNLLPQSKPGPSPLCLYGKMSARNV